MASGVHVPPDSPSKPFLTGSYVFTRAQAICLARLNNAGVTVWQLKEDHFPNATIKELIIAIQVGILIDYDFYNLDDLLDLDPRVFDTSTVCLDKWLVGEPRQSNE